MARSLRYDRIQQHALQRGVRTARVITTLRYMPLAYWFGAIGFTLICLLPLAWRIEPLPYYLGYVGDTDVRARLDFDFNTPLDPEDGLASSVLPIYEEEPRSQWMRDVFSPVANLIESAADLRDPEALLAFAEKEGIELTPKQAGILTDFLLKEQSSKLYSDILEPIRRILEVSIYQRGVISQTQLRLERESDLGRIEIVGTRSSLEQDRVLSISADSPNAPLDPTEAGRRLEREFYNDLWLIKRAVRQVLADLILDQIKQHPTLVYNATLTESTLAQRRKQRMEDAQRVLAGTLLLRRGQSASAEDLRQLRAEEQAYRLQQGFYRIFFRFLGKALLLLLISIVFAAVYYQFNRATDKARRSALGIAVLALLLIGGAHLLIYLGVPGTLLPVGLAAALAALLCGRATGVLTAGAMALYLLVLYEGQVDVIAGYFIGGTAMAILLPATRFRQRVFPIANLCGLLAALIVLSVGWAGGEMPQFDLQQARLLDLGYSGNLWIRAIWTYGAWLASSVLILLLLPLLPRLFGVTSQIQLQDLQDQEHPCLRQLLIEAPSTYHHSQITGTLAESAAYAIGANALLCKVASYYHDIGKMIKPEYFTENESGISRHDSLTANMSKLIIINHVKDGIEMAGAFGLPAQVIDLIEQHHGTTAVSFFYHRAKEQANEPENVEEDSFRYPGPRPRNAEAAILMIADSVEAASRSLEQAAPEQIRKLVHGIIMNKLAGRQFDDAPITLRDLEKIEETIVHLLASMLHSRVQYPGSQKKKEERPSRRN